jgi:hypothetical protein
MGDRHATSSTRLQAQGFRALKFYSMLSMEVPKYLLLPSRRTIMAVSPIKVNAETKEQIRVGAALLKCSQAELVGRAVSEYTARHAGELRAGIAGASAALALGDGAAIAYLAGSDVDTLERVTGRRPLE